jgi:ferrochelatase
METLLLSGLQELHDQGVTEVMLFPLYPQHAMASTTTILELAEDHRKKYFPEMKFTIVPAFIINQTIQNLADSIKGHLEGYDYDHLLFSYTSSRASHSQNRHYKITL